MKTRYIDLIEQTFDFPKDEFNFRDGNLTWNDLPLTEIIEKYGTPLRISYLPKIGEKIDEARAHFAKAFKEHKYVGTYTYFYCTKSNHFQYVIDKGWDLSMETPPAPAKALSDGPNAWPLPKMKALLTTLCQGHRCAGQAPGLPRDHALITRRGRGETREGE